MPFLKKSENYLTIFFSAPFQFRKFRSLRGLAPACSTLFQFRHSNGITLFLRFFSVSWLPSVVFLLTILYTVVNCKLYFSQSVNIFLHLCFTLLFTICFPGKLPLLFLYQSNDNLLSSHFYIYICSFIPICRMTYQSSNAVIHYAVRSCVERSKSCQGAFTSIDFMESFISFSPSIRTFSVSYRALCGKFPDVLLLWIYFRRIPPESVLWYVFPWFALCPAVNPRCSPRSPPS